MKQQFPPDRAVDAAVAEKVMGYRRIPVPPDYDGRNGGTEVLVPPDFDHHRYTWPARGIVTLTHMVPYYSACFDLAWRVFESLTRRGWMVLLKYDPEREKNRWTCWVSWPTPNDRISKYDAVQAATDNPAHSICLAAIRAVDAAGSSSSPTDLPSTKEEP